MNSVFFQPWYEAEFSGKERALIWLYIKTWSFYGEHLIEFKKYFSGGTSKRCLWHIKYYEERYQGLWTFGEDDMEAAFVAMALPKKEDSRIDRLNSWHFEISFSDQRLWTIIYDSIFTILMIICESSISCGSHCSRQINSTFLIPEFSPKIQVLKKMILDQFDNDFPKYYEWSLKIRQMVN